ncbi:MAG: ABC transporter permease [Rhizobiaceae bacterium]|nr:ABC transporter permease [Rhizobiaceae bacterium]
MDDENPLVVQLRVILALVLRETRVAFGTAQLGYLWAIANPVFGVAALAIIFSTISRHPPIGSSFVLFYATGMLPFEMYQKYAKSLMKVFDQNRGLYAYPLVKNLDPVYARCILVFATYCLVLFVFFSALILIGLSEFPSHIHESTLAIVALSMLGIGAGMINAVIKALWSTWPQIEGIISRPLFFISGIFFIPTMFSSEIRYWLSWNPVLHVIEWFREGYYPNYESVVLDKGYLFLCIGILLLLGFGGERLYRKHII